MRRSESHPGHRSVDRSDEDVSLVRFGGVSNQRRLRATSLEPIRYGSNSAHSG